MSKIEFSKDEAATIIMILRHLTGILHNSTYAFPEQNHNLRNIEKEIEKSHDKLKDLKNDLTKKYKIGFKTLKEAENRKTWKKILEGKITGA